MEGASYCCSGLAPAIPWTIIDGPNTARAVADKLEAAPISRARMTSISSALQFSKELLAASGVKGLRRVIDVSGDGPNNAGLPVTGIRDELVASGIVINGLPIVLKGIRDDRKTTKLPIFGMHDTHCSNDATIAIDGPEGVELEVGGHVVGEFRKSLVGRIAIFFGNFRFGGDFLQVRAQFGR